MIALSRVRIGSLAPRCLLVAGMLIAPFAAQSSVVFSALSPACCSVLVPGQSIGTESGTHYAWASQFTASAGGSLSDVTLGLYRIGSTASAATVSLHADNGGSVGAQMASGSGTPVDQYGAGASYLNVSMSAASIVAGITYWLEVDAGTPQVDWRVSDLAGLSVGFFDAAGATKATDFQFSVQVNDAVPTVPEPGSLALVALALAGVVTTRRR